MKKNLLLPVIFLSCVHFVSAQKAGDVLENGIRIIPGEKIFLQFDKEVLKYDKLKSFQDMSNPPDFITLGDSTIFLVSKNGVNVYLKPLNPLNYTVNTEIKEITDPVYETAITAFGAILASLNESMTATPPGRNGVPEGQQVIRQAPTILLDTCQGFWNIVSNLYSIQNLLQNNQKAEMIRLFHLLKGLSFADEANTVSDLDNIAKSMAVVEACIDSIDHLSVQTRIKIASYSCNTVSAYFMTYMVNSIFRDLNASLQEQKTRFKNLQNVFILVKEAQTKASFGGGEQGLKWCTKLDEVSSQTGKVSLYKVSIAGAGYALSDKDEIVCSDSKDSYTRTLRIMKFQRFIPEVSVGTAYTFLSYNTYGITTDTAGQQHVASPTENSVHNLKITTMINFNYYIPNSFIHPAYQVGLGLNGEIPTLLTGFGIRSSIGGIKRLTISGGIAMTWLRVLDTLQEGDVVSGSDDIEKDLIYEFSWPPKPYIGLQYNF